MGHYAPAEGHRLKNTWTAQTELEVLKEKRKKEKKKKWVR